MRAFACALVLLAIAGVATAAGTRPTLRVASTGETVVHGLGFAKREQLKLTARIQGGTLVRRVTASRLGTFTVRLAGRVDPCTGGHVVQVLGPKSGLVRLKLPLRECPVPPIP
jgi:hypothetical protein